MLKPIGILCSGWLKDENSIIALIKFCEFRSNCPIQLNWMCLFRIKLLPLAFMKGREYLCTTTRTCHSNLPKFGSIIIFIFHILSNLIIKSIFLKGDTEILQKNIFFLNINFKFKLWLWNIFKKYYLQDFLFV